MPAFAGREPDPYAVPTDYAELFDQYWDYTVGLVRKLGISPQSMEDVASDILLRFYERDFLTEFDPDLVFDRQTGKVKARFKSFLSAFIERYVRGHRDRQTVHAHREPLVCDQPVGDGSAIWVEVFGGEATDDLSGVEEWELVEAVQSHLRTIPVRGKRDLPKLFDLVVNQVRRTGRANRRELAAQFGVSDTAICSMFVELRTAVSFALRDGGW